MKDRMRETLKKKHCVTLTVLVYIYISIFLNFVEPKGWFSEVHSIRLALKMSSV